MPAKMRLQVIFILAFLHALQGAAPYEDYYSDYADMLADNAYEFDGAFDWAIEDDYTDDDNETKYDADVLILGAGMSGIVAAKTLYENGVKNFTILEARDRIGGRMRSEEFGGIRVELGEQWIYGWHMDNDPPQRLTDQNDTIQKLAERCGMKGITPQYNEKKVFYNKDKAIDNEIIQHLSVVFKNATGNALMYSLLRQVNGLPDITVKQALKDIGWHATTPLEKLLEWDFFDFLKHESTETASFYRSIPNMVWNDFGIDYLVLTDQRGSEHLLHCLAEDFRLAPNDPRLKLSTRVTSVHNGNSSVCVDTVSGWKRKTYCAKYALVTFSIGVLQSPNLVQFVPPLPAQKRAVINFFPMGLVDRIFLKFNHTFWANVPFIDRVDSFLGRFAAFQPFDNVRYNISKTNHHVIVWSFTDKAADVISSQPTSVTKREALDVLHEMFPQASIPEPEEFLITNWRNDPLYRGATVTKPVGATDEMYEVLAAPVGRLHFSGDAVHKDYGGLLQAAYYSSIKAGEAIASALNATQ